MENFETEAQKYYNEGWNSFYLKEEKNPYKKNSREYSLWKEGRWDAKNTDTDNYN